MVRQFKEEVYYCDEAIVNEFLSFANKNETDTETDTPTEICTNIEIALAIEKTKQIEAESLARQVEAQSSARQLEINFEMLKFKVSHGLT